MQVFWFEVSWVSDNTVQVELMQHFCLQCVFRSQVIYDELLVEVCVFSAMGKHAELEAEMEKNIEACMGGLETQEPGTVHIRRIFLVWSAG